MMPSGDRANASLNRSRTSAGKLPLLISFKLVRNISSRRMRVTRYDALPPVPSYASTEIACAPLIGSHMSRRLIVKPRTKTLRVPVLQLGVSRFAVMLDISASPAALHSSGWFVLMTTSLASISGSITAPRRLFVRQHLRCASVALRNVVVLVAMWAVASVS
jgi:hypothetical protein